MRTRRAWRKYILAGAAALAALASLDPAHAHLRVLHRFDGSDGVYPAGVLVGDGAGNLYGTTVKGGSGGCYGGCGTVFKLAPDGTETVLYSFGSRANDGSEADGLIRDKRGNLYGTTAFGGGSGCEGVGCGTVFRIAPDGSETLLYAFAGGSDGEGPNTGVIEDKSGNLYGTTVEGGNADCEGDGCGTVFRLAPDGTETVLYAFTGGSDGATPQAPLIEDSTGNLYGTTSYGGNDLCTDGVGCGTVFRVAPDGSETVLYTFKGNADGANPFSALVADGAGDFYGTTYEGGQGCSGYGCGTVFELAADGSERVLHAFAGGSDGDAPIAGLVRDKAGSLYGTTELGGVGIGCGFGEPCGTVFKLAPDGTETVLHAFGTRSRGYYPESTLMQDRDGHLYGTTVYGGARHGQEFCGGFPRHAGLPPLHQHGCGTVFTLEK